MSGNSFGTIFKLSTFGESHGKAIGGVIEGCPSGLSIDEKFIQDELNRRRPGQSEITSPRNEKDQVELLSGISEGISTGTPIGFIIRNEDQLSKDYDHLNDAFRPGHADFTYLKKYGLRDHKGGGRSSARETISRIVGGAIAKLILKESGVSIKAFVKQVGEIKLDKGYQELDLSKTEESIVRCPDPIIATEMEKLILKAKEDGDSVGGIIQCVIDNVPAGLGEPVFNKLHAQLGHAMLGINAVKGFEFGRGFESVSMKGSEFNDQFVKDFVNCFGSYVLGELIFLSGFLFSYDSEFIIKFFGAMVPHHGITETMKGTNGETGDPFVFIPVFLAYDVFCLKGNFLVGKCLLIFS